ncbi:ribosome maturation factor RimP [Rhodococcus sp. NBC_00294]|uniref:ribosome maturation factor RimP n=1 Tax=Rhodococcus sp. NBC_00294 TaxID=2976004 RepID=UPI002E2D73BD|nr:ribosome maturation factor RimP [Rhodococcus sp. NBC_00294]
MPVPSRERVVALLSAHVAGPGFTDGDLDLEDVTVSKAGAHSVVKVIVDRDSGFELDALARLSHEISDILDAATEFGDTAYNLEVTTPGVDRPLTEPRHWRRARGRMVTVVLGDETIDARVGELRTSEGGTTELDLVLRSRTGPTLRTVPLDSVTSATVQVEFKKPNPAELEMAGGVTPGRFDPLNPPEEPVSGDEDDDTDDESR